MGQSFLEEEHGGHKDDYNKTKLKQSLGIQHQHQQPQQHQQQQLLNNNKLLYLLHSSDEILSASMQAYRKVLGTDEALKLYFAKFDKDEDMRYDIVRNTNTNNTTTTIINNNNNNNNSTNSKDSKEGKREWIMSTNMALGTLLGGGGTQKGGPLPFYNSIHKSNHTPETYAIISQGYATRNMWEDITTIYASQLNKGNFSEDLGITIIKGISREMLGSGKITNARAVIDNISDMVGIYPKEWTSARYWTLKKFIGFHYARMLQWKRKPTFEKETHYNEYLLALEHLEAYSSRKIFVKGDVLRCIVGYFCWKSGGGVSGSIGSSSDGMIGINNSSSRMSSSEDSQFVNRWNEGRNNSYDNNHHQSILSRSKTDYDHYYSERSSTKITKELPQPQSQQQPTYQHQQHQQHQHQHQHQQHQHQHQQQQSYEQQTSETSLVLQSIKEAQRNNTSSQPHTLLNDPTFVAATALALHSLGAYNECAIFVKDRVDFGVELDVTTLRIGLDAADHVVVVDLEEEEEEEGKEGRN